MVQNTSPDVSEFCVESTVIGSTVPIRFIGGIGLEPQIDPTSGPPSSCGLTLDLIGNLQSALAPFQPFLTLLDCVSSLAQCFLLLTEVVQNPFKIKDLLACIPGLISKINTLLQLVPVLPQGVVAFITFITDVIRFVGTQLDCVIGILQSIQGQADQIALIQFQIENTDDAQIVAGLQELLECTQEEQEQQAGLAVSALGPIARLLCTVRGLLALVPGGNEIQKQLAFGDPSNIEALDDAIETLETVRDTLLGVVDIVVSIAAPFGGVIPPPDLTFVCPLDDLEDEEDTEPPPVPVITDLQDPGGLPLVPPVAGSGDKDIVIVGTNLSPPEAKETKTGKVFFGTAQIPAGSIITLSNELIALTIPAGLLENDGTFKISVVNEPTGGTGTAFSGLTEDVSQPPSAEESPVKVSDPFDFEVDPL